jgi:hypothetical protein
MTGTLAHYNQFTAALAKAASVDEVKEIHDKATALKAAAKILNDRKVVADMAAVRAKAERRLGEFMEAGKADRAGRGRPKNISGKCLLPTLKELKINDNLAHRARRAAALSQEAFDALIADQRESILESSSTNQIYYPECEAEVAEKKAERKRARAEGKKRRAEAEAELERTRPEREARFAAHQAWVGAEPDDDVVEVAPVAPVAPVEVKPCPAPAPAADSKSKQALGEFKYACGLYLRKLSPEDFGAAISYAQSFAPADANA